MVSQRTPNGPWDIHHPFQDIVETASNREVPPAEKANAMLAILKRVFRDKEVELFVGYHAQENHRLAVVIDIARQIGIKFHIVFTPPEEGGQWYEKEAMVEVAPMQTAMGSAGEDEVGDGQIPYPHQILANETVRYTAANNLEVKRLYQWLDEFRHLEAPYFITGVETHLPGESAKE